MPFIDATPTGDSVDFDKFKHYHNFEDEIRECFDYISEKSKPYLVTLRDCIDVGYYGPNNQRYAHKLIEYITTLIDNIDGQAITMENHTELTANNPENTVYHCCKVMYLINQYNEVGLHSTLQAITEGNHMFVHPGCSRIHAHSYLEAYNEKIIVWEDITNFPIILHQEHHYHSMNYDIFKIIAKQYSR